MFFQFLAWSHPHDIFWTNKTQKLMLTNTIKLRISHRLHRTIFGYLLDGSPNGEIQPYGTNPWRLRALGTLVALAATKTWSRLRKTFNWMAVYMAWFRRVVFAVAFDFLLLWDRLFFFFGTFCFQQSVERYGLSKWSQTMVATSRHVSLCLFLFFFLRLSRDFL